MKNAEEFRSDDGDDTLVRASALGRSAGVVRGLAIGVWEQSAVRRYRGNAASMWRSVAPAERLRLVGVCALTAMAVHAAFLVTNVRPVEPLAWVVPAVIAAAGVVLYAVAPNLARVVQRPKT